MRSSTLSIRATFPDVAAGHPRLSDSSMIPESYSWAIHRAEGSRGVAPLTPEPISMTLLAVGLVGVMAVGRVRRPQRRRDR